MVYLLPRRGPAIIATATMLAAGSFLVPAIPTASAVDPAGKIGTQALLGGLLDLLDGVLTMTTEELQAALAGLTPSEIGDLLVAADPAELTALLGALTTTQLTDALGTLTPTETGDLLAGADPTQLTTLLGALTTTQLLDALGTLTPTELASVVDGLSPTQAGDLLAVADATQLTALLDSLTTTQITDALGTLDAAELTSVVGALSPAQITDLLGSASGTASVLTGLDGIATAILAGGTPDAASVDALLAQVQALLGGGLPVLADQIATMNSLLTSVTSLVSTAGVDTTLLTTLLDTATATLGSALPGTVTGPLENLIEEITTLLPDPLLPDPILPGTTPPGTTPPATNPPATNPPATTPPGTTTPPNTTTPTPGPFDHIPSTGPFTAKLGLARATIVRRDRQLDVLAPITARASGRVKVDLFAARRHHRFTAPVDSANGRVRFKERIPKAQADLGTGIMTIDYAGDDNTRPQSVRLRAASQPAALDLERPTLVDGRLKASGTVTSKARGVVRTQLQYLFLGETKTLKFKAKIHDGRWKLDEKLPDTALWEIIYRTGSVHSYTLFTGYFPERIRGEMRSYQVLGDRP